METAHETHRLPTLSIADKMRLMRGFADPDYFRTEVRPMLYRKCGDDAETVHELTLDLLHREGRRISKLPDSFFPQPRELRVRINGREVVPFGTAAGLDKNGDALFALGRIFGMQEPGTVVVTPREGNRRVRVAMDPSGFHNIFNAQGFPSRGLDHFLRNISEYRNGGGMGRVYVSVCGLPLSDGNAIETAAEEMRTLIKALRPHADGFVWNPFSPNTTALAMLRNRQVFYETSRLMRELAPDKLRMVKIGPYGDSEERRDTIGMVRGFMEGGGHGVVTTNTRKVDRESMPEPARSAWGYPTAGMSGACLREHMLRSVRDMRVEFPDSVIFATGAIFSPEAAYSAVKSGANGVEGYTPYVIYGLGRCQQLMKGTLKLLRAEGFRTLAELQQSVADRMRRGP